ncbi:MAG: hypothetical protein LBR79_03125 [Oscillospiraceae bacterium]|jgi:hypothetical protein|nr:hypothetical protein [Oscillospiraceae bacterium]
MKFKIKNFMVFMGMYIILLFNFFTDLSYARTRPGNDFFVYLNTNTNGNEKENSNKPCFVKFTERAINFLGNSLVLLYGGIFLVAVSVVSIVFILMPKKNQNSP